MVSDGEPSWLKAFFNSRNLLLWTHFGEKANKIPEIRDGLAILCPVKLECYEVYFFPRGFETKKESKHYCL